MPVMAWLELRLQLRASQQPEYESLLQELGALCITMQDAEDQPILEPSPGDLPLWDRLQLAALFTPDTDAERLILSLAARVAPALLPRFGFRMLDDRDWQNTWMERAGPMKFGDRLWIYPTGPAPHSANAGIIVELSPGLAFGSGSHPTTAMCLEWLDQHGLEGKTVVDYGCGSGVLAISAAKLGAQQVIAVDHDPQAIRATRDNAEKNGVAGVISTVMPGTVQGIVADIIIANILLGPLIELRDVFTGCLVENGVLVMTGILDTQADDLQRAYSGHFDFVGCEQREEWVRLQALRLPDV